MAGASSARPAMESPRGGSSINQGTIRSVERVEILGNDRQLEAQKRKADDRMTVEAKVFPL